MSASDWAMMGEEIDNLKSLLGELYQILGQFQGEIPEDTLNKIIAHTSDEGWCDGRFADEYESLLPFVRGEVK